MNSKKIKKGDRHWYDYLVDLHPWTYLILGFFNIMFAWLGLICFLVPLAISIVTGSKLYCNRYCGRGQLFSILGNKLHLSPGRPVPRWMKSKAFRYGFLIFFLFMFCQMLFNTWLVFRGASGLKQVVTVLWTFRLPWNHAYHAEGVPLWMSQFAFGFYSVMLTSTILGLATMVLFPPPLLVCVLSHGNHDTDDMQGPGCRSCAPRPAAVLLPAPPLSCGTPSSCAPPSCGSPSSCGSSFSGRSPVSGPSGSTEPDTRDMGSIL